VAGLEEAKGKLKEAAGDLTGSEGLRREGQAQQQKDRHESEAEQAKLKADEHERQAANAERRESRQQGT
jgi:uncharacterized protein YjbJ (UPF0337 family)